MEALRLNPKSVTLFQKTAWGDGELKIVAFREPCLLLEAAELVYALVNNIPSEQMTLPGEYYLPVEAVESIRRAACAGISPEDSRLQFYFRGVPIEGIAERLSCVGCCLLYSSVEVGHPGPEDMARALGAAWARHRREHYCIDGIDPFTLNIHSTEETSFSSISGEIAQLPLPAAYKLQLVEAFSAFDAHAAEVTELLRPVAEALRPLLAPWVERSAPRMEEWETFFRQNSAEEFLLKRGMVKVTDIRELQIGFRYFSPLLCPIDVDEKAGRVAIHMGIGIRPEMEVVRQKPVMDDSRYIIMRMLANPDRVEMLRLMMDRPMGVPELSKRLHLNSGSVFRDVNSMYNAQLLLFQPENGKNLYSTNLQAVKKTVADLTEYIGSGGDK